MVENQTAPNEQFPEDFYRDPLGLDRYVVQEKVLHSWKAPSKIERHRSKSEVMQIGLFFVLVGLIILLMGEWLLAMVLGIGAVIYVLVLMSKATLLDCHITTIGIKVDGKYYYWEQLSQFWFESRRGTRILFLRNLFQAPQYVKLIIPNDQEEAFAKTLGKYLLYKKPTLTQFEAWTEQLMDAILSHFDSF